VKICNAHRPAATGFTLIEVLVALAIVGLGLIAVFGQVSQSVTTATRLRDKTLADWIAVDRITELRLTGDFPAIGTRSDDVDMANTKWRYSVKVSATEVADIRRADVSVGFAENPDRPLVTVAGFLVSPVQPRVPPITSGWEPITAEDAATPPGQNPPPPPNPPSVPGPPPIQTPPTQPSKT
jgi:general secretion pathway protein I